MKIPNEDDWGNYKDDLEQEWAYKVFGGKSNDEVQKEFVQNVIERTDELRFMPVIPFRYYMLGFMKFVMSGNFEICGSSDAASCFLDLVKEKLIEYPEHILPIMDELYPAVEYVAKNQQKYDADLEIYGDFLQIFENIRTQYENAK